MSILDCTESWVERFWSNVDKSGECWIWTRPLHKSRPTDPIGYGIFCIGDVRYRAHRVAFMLTDGPIPEGMHICHHCDNPPCVRPDHLFLGTNADNQADRKAKGRYPSGPDAAFRRYPELPQMYSVGENNWSAKLTEADVLEIRWRYAEERRATYRSLAAEYGVDKSNIEAIVRRRSWRHI